MHVHKWEVWTISMDMNPLDIMYVGERCGQSIITVYREASFSALAAHPNLPTHPRHQQGLDVALQSIRDKRSDEMGLTGVKA